MNGTHTDNLVGACAAGVLIVVLHSGPLPAQALPDSSARAAAREPTTSPRLRLPDLQASSRLSPAAAATAPVQQPPFDFRDFSNHVGWGMTIGAAAGFLYGVATKDWPPEAILILFDTVAGATIGLVAGAVVFFVRSAVGRGG